MSALMNRNTLIKSVPEATEHLFLVARQMQHALDEIIAEDHVNTGGIDMAREALKKSMENPLLMDCVFNHKENYKEISDKSPSLLQMQKLVGGDVQMIILPDGRQMFCDQDGRNKSLPVNGRASILVGSCVLGVVVILSGVARWDDREFEEKEEE